HESTLVAVGERGTVLVSFDGGLGWSIHPPLSDHLLIGVWMPDRRYVVIVGNGGTIMRGTR
ncbi:MAG TPA: hypothetical protein VFQ45_10465, partial [Longimicrobium sp.]|nr:hypothetical protein [Longimicrobium sp.]